MKLLNRLSRSGAVVVPYLWLLLFFLAPFAIVLKISLSEVVIAWQLLRHAEIALPGADGDPFLAGKVASARFFVAHTAPKVAARRAAAEVEDGALMELAAVAF